MKKFSVILASLVLFAGMTFAQQSSTMPSGSGSKGPSKGGSTGKSSSTGTATPTGSTAPVKKVPASKTKTATPMAKPAAAPAK